MNIISFILENWRWELLLIIVIALIIRRIIKGYFIIDREGNPINFKTFMSRWKDGLSGITPLQQAKANLWGVWIVIVGEIAGIIVNCIVRLKDTWWWLTIILAGSLFLTVIQTIGFYQRYKLLKRVDDEVKKLEVEGSES